MQYVEVKEYGDLKAGDQIAVLGLLEDLHSSLKVLYVVVGDSPYYFHHGIYIGDLTVVDFHGQTKADAKPRHVGLREFDNGVGRKLFKVDYEGVETFSPDMTIRMAKELISNTDDKSKWPEYDVIWNNCETMATYLKTGKKLSIQAGNALLRGLAAIAGSVAAVALCVTRSVSRR